MERARTRLREEREAEAKLTNPSLEQRNELKRALLAKKAIPRALFAASGAGYALRAAFAIALVSPTAATSTTRIAIWIGFWASGAAAVAAGWVIEFTGAVRRGDNAVNPNILAKPDLYWAASHLGPNTTDPTQVLVKPGHGFATFDETKSFESRKYRLWQFQGNKRAPWRVALYLAVLTTFTVQAIELPYQQWVPIAAGLVTIVVLLIQPWTTKQRPLSLIVIVVAVALLSLGVAITGTWHITIACMLLLARHIHKVSAAETGRLKDLIEAATKQLKKVRRAGRAIKKGAGVAAAYVFGYAVIHSVDRRYRRTEPTPVPPEDPEDESALTST